MSDDTKEPGIERLDLGRGMSMVHKDKKMHSVDDQPAVIYPDGTKWWYRDGVLHRDNGPAVVWENGVEEWFRDGVRDRADGPAVIYPDNDGIVAELRGVRQFWSKGNLVSEDMPPRVKAYRDAVAALRKQHFGGP